MKRFGWILFILGVSASLFVFFFFRHERVGVEREVVASEVPARVLRRERRDDSVGRRLQGPWRETQSSTPTTSTHLRTREPNDVVPDRELLTETPEQACNRVHRMQVSRILAHEQEGIDPNWSAYATSQFQSFLNQVRQSAGFSLVQADCRMTTCLARIRWEPCLQAVRRIEELRRARPPSSGPVTHGCTILILQERP